MTHWLFLIGAAVVVVGIVCVSLYGSVRKHTDMLANVAHSLATAEIALDLVQKDMAELKVKFDNREEDEQKALVEALERKWEQATQAIQNFDPYKTGEK